MLFEDDDLRSTTCMRRSLDRSNVIAVSYRRRAIGADVANRLEAACKWHTYVYVHGKNTKLRYVYINE
jgi:hypothetical protein